MKKRLLYITSLVIFFSECSPAPASLFTVTPLPSRATQTPLPPPSTATLPPSPTVFARPKLDLPIDPEAGDLWERPGDGMMMAFITAGKFTIGSEPEDPCAHLDEQPIHEVYLDDFWIDQTEVTNTQYKKCVTAGLCLEPTVCGSGEWTYQDPLKNEYPVTCLTWDETQAYCGWIGGRLPSEAQWEKAARGTEENKFPWGNEFDAAKCNSQESEIDGPRPVGSYSPQGDSPYGLMDVAGNVWEWTGDWYDIDYYGIATSQDPRGPKTGDRRSLRGGSWYANYCSVRTSYRYYDVPNGRSTGVGFRCVVVP